MPAAGYELQRELAPSEIQLILLDMTKQFTQKELAEKFGISLATVQRLLKDPKAEDIRLAAQTKIKEELVREATDEIPDLVRLAVSCVRRTLEADIAPTHKAKPNQDKVALDILKGFGVLKQDDEALERGGFKLNNEQFDALITALEKSDRVREIEALPLVEATVVG